MTYAGQRPDAYALAIRPLREEEIKAALGFLKPMRYNAIGWAVVGILLAIFILIYMDNLSEENLIVLAVPFLFVANAISYSSKFRKTLAAIRKAAESGMIPEIAGAPAKQRFGGSWKLGPVSFSGSGEMKKTLAEETFSRFAFMPDVSIIISMNGVPLKKPLRIIGPAGFGKDIFPPTERMMPVVATPVIQPRYEEEIPPPPPPDD